MKIEVITDNRVGMTQEVLAGLAEHSLDLTAVEVTTEHIYLDLPELTAVNLPAVSETLRTISGVRGIAHIDLLPNERRRLHLDALLSTLSEPVFAVDAEGLILSANAAATTPLGTREQALIGKPIASVLVGNNGFAVSSVDGQPEVTLAGQPYFLEQRPIRTPLNEIAASSEAGSDSGVTVGSMWLLHAPNRLGNQLSRVQMGDIAGFDAIAGQSRVLMQVKERAKRFAVIRAPLLIQGETGTGKELFARAVHQAGPGHAAAFLALNCAALPENLVESELFGYAPGAFSGANRGGKPGLLELADGGTVFLDEIGEMSIYVQAKLLRFIQDGSFRRIGGKEERKVDVRIICATHRDLEQQVSEGKFREDLMYRLNVLTLALPPLRERTSDIGPLAELFILRAAKQIDCAAPRLSGDAKAMLSAQAWPGNVRQLENVLFRTVALCQGRAIGPEELQLAGMVIEDAQTVDEPKNWKEAQAAFEKDLLSQLYERYPSTRKLAKRLEVSHTTIADKLRAYNISLKG